MTGQFGGGGRRREGGFTLVEVLCAGMILAISAMVIGRIVMQHLRAVEKAERYQVCAGLLDEIFTKLDVIGPARVMDEGPESGDFSMQGHDDFTWSLEVTERDEGAYLYDVAVTILWDVNGRKGSEKSRTTFFDPPESRDENLNWEDL